jgi:hypothetical protein
VGLLGDSAGYLAVAIRAAATSEATVADAAYRMLDMFSVVFGIPLSFAALLTGITLGVGSKWEVFRYPWVMAKLLLIVSIIAVGAFVLRGGMDAMLTGGGGGEVRLVAGAAYDVLALAVATGLAVYKPGRPHSRKAAADRQALLPRP